MLIPVTTRTIAFLRFTDLNLSPKAFKGCYRPTNWSTLDGPNPSALTEIKHINACSVVFMSLPTIPGYGYEMNWRLLSRVKIKTSDPKTRNINCPAYHSSHMRDLKGFKPLSHLLAPNLINILSSIVVEICPRHSFRYLLRCSLNMTSIAKTVGSRGCDQILPSNGGYYFSYQWILTISTGYPEFVCNNTSAYVRLTCFSPDFDVNS